MEDNRIALVTGSNRGIGLEVVKQLSEIGYHVILTSRSEEKGQDAYQSLGKPVNVSFHQLDVNDQSSVDNMLQFVKNHFNRLDVLINNAGINYDSGQKAISVDLDDVLQTLQTNLLGCWRMAKAFIPLMQQNKYGRIVNVSSGAGAIQGMKGGTPAYGISKAALNALTKKLADELKNQNILVNAVCPGWVRTDMGGSMASRSVSKGAETILWVAGLKDKTMTGKFFRDKQEISF